MENKKNTSKSKSILIIFFLIFISVVSVGIIYAFIYAWFEYIPKTKNQQIVNNGIAEFIQNKYDSKLDTDCLTLNLNRVVPFEWDTMAIFFEYQDSAFINKTLKIKYLGKQIPDGKSIYIFLKNGKIVYEELFSTYISNYPRVYRFYFEQSNLSWIYTDSLFFVKKTEQLFDKYTYKLIPYSSKSR